MTSSFLGSRFEIGDVDSSQLPRVREGSLAKHAPLCCTMRARTYARGRTPVKLAVGYITYSLTEFAVLSCWIC